MRTQLSGEPEYFLRLGVDDVNAYERVYVSALSQPPGRRHSHVAWGDEGGEGVRGNTG